MCQIRNEESWELSGFKKYLHEKKELNQPRLNLATQVQLIQTQTKLPLKKIAEWISGELRNLIKKSLRDSRD